MRDVCLTMDDPGCWHRQHAFAGHLHEHGLLAQPRRPASSPSESPEPDSEENLAFYLEVGILQEDTLPLSERGEPCALPRDQGVHKKLRYL